MLQSSQTQATQAPSFYTNYLSNIANQASGFLPGQPCAPQYVGAQPLQTKAFESACKSAGTYQPSIAAGQGYIGQAAGQDITGAAQPFLQAGTTASPLCAAKPLISQAGGLNLAGLASEYMSPYIQCAVQRMSDIGMRNIRQNLAPQATAAAVGSGQFGSQRGAQVLGQVEANAMQDLNSQIANMLNTGYTTALCAAKAKQGILSQLAGTTSAAQQAQNQAQLTAGQTAASAAAQEAKALQEAGLGMGTLGTQGQNINLACINALATLGGQQQTIGQNQQMFPLTTLSNLASILQGYSIPTTTKTQLCMSPLSAAAAIGAGTLGMFTPTTTGGVAPINSIFSSLKDMFNSNSGPELLGGGGGTLPPETQTLPDGRVYDRCGNILSDAVELSGLFNPPSSSPVGLFNPPVISCAGYVDESPIKFSAKGGLMKAASGGAIGCKSTRKRGGLPK
jgi:hypothetical protein